MWGNQWYTFDTHPLADFFFFFSSGTIWAQKGSEEQFRTKRPYNMREKYSEENQAKLAFLPQILAEPFPLEQRLFPELLLVYG